MIKIEEGCRALGTEPLRAEGHDYWGLYRTEHLRTPAVADSHTAAVAHSYKKKWKNFLSSRWRKETSAC